MINFDLNYQGVKLYFGEGSVTKLSAHIKGLEKVIIVMGKSSGIKSGAFDDVKHELEKYNTKYYVYDGITPNPTVQQAQTLVELLRKESADGIVAIGGGSVIDTAKVAGVAKAENGNVMDYFLYRKKATKTFPLFVVNLTHGTGTEVDRYSVLTESETKKKRGMVTIYPTVSADDPKYLISLQKDQTIFTSLDAFYHSYESSTKISSSPYVDAHSNVAVSTIQKWLPKTLGELSNKDYRYWLLYASMMAGIAIDLAGTHIIHLIEHAISGTNPYVPHGAGLAIIGPRAVYYVHKFIPEKSAPILSILDPNIMSVKDDAEKAEKALKKFQENIGFKQTLGDYGIGRDDVKNIVNMALESLKLQGKGIPILKEEDIEDIVLSGL
ncbi:MAG: iron-containing alcohol dehydrogenase [Thermoplasmata archaeon]